MVADRGRVTDGARSAGSDAARRRAHMPEGTSAILDTRSLATAHRRLAALLRPGLSVLDVGCGTGAITRGIAETVGPEGRVVGVDVNASMIDKARAAHRGVPGLSFEVADVAGRAGGGRGARVAGRQAHHAAVRARPWRFRHDGSVDAAQPRRARSPGLVRLRQRAGDHAPDPVSPGRTGACYGRADAGRGDAGRSRPLETRPPRSLS